MPLGAYDLVFGSQCLMDLPFKDKVDAAASAGFAGINMLITDYVRARAEGLSDADIAALVDDRGLLIGEVEVLAWQTGGRVSRELEEQLYAIADAVKARSINICLLAVEMGGQGDAASSVSEVFDRVDDLTVPLGRIEDAAASLAGICDRAKEHGLRVHIEFFPWTELRDLPTAWEIVRLADRPNAGIHLDVWHFFRSGGTLEQLATVPADRIFCVQISDGPAHPDPGLNLIQETITRRVLPGEGEFDLVGVFRHLRKAGATSPICCEVFFPETADPTDVADRLAASTRKVLAQASSG